MLNELLTLNFQIIFFDGFEHFPYLFHLFVGIQCIFATKLMKTNLWKLVV